MIDNILDFLDQDSKESLKKMIKEFQDFKLEISNDNQELEDLIDGEPILDGS